MKQKNPEARCENCPYWNDEDSEGFMDECRRYAPSTTKMTKWDGSNPDTDAIFPKTCKFAWCGEHPDFFAK